MRGVLVFGVLLAVVGLSFETILGYDNQQQKMRIYQQQVIIVNRLLESECPHLIESREVGDVNLTPLGIEVVKNLYNSLLKKLLECRAKKASSVFKPQAPDNLNSTEPPFKDCQEYYEQGYSEPGVYEIKLPNSNLLPFEVWCDFLDYHGWTVIQRKINLQMDFNRDWDSYKNGFGNLSNEHWLGNQRIHELTKTNPKLNINLADRNGNQHSGTWRQFTISDESDQYRLNISDVGFSGSSSEYFTRYHNGMKFSTRDRDNENKGGNCAAGEEGGWWYDTCAAGRSNLNRGASGGMYWYSVGRVESSVMRVTRELQSLKNRN